MQTIFPCFLDTILPHWTSISRRKRAYMGPKNLASDLDAQNSGIRFKLLGLQATALSGSRPVC